MRRTLQNLAPMDPPTDAEKHDAILVLSDPENAAVPSLWIEAHLIFIEASEPVLAKSALAELTRRSQETEGGYR